MTPDTVAFIAMLLSAGVLAFNAWRKRKAVEKERARRKARAQARYRERYRQAGAL